jgi:hypothetical protein
MLRKRGFASAAVSGEVDRHPAADSKRRGPEPLGVLSAASAHEELSRLQSGGPHNPLASLSAARFRVGGNLGKAQIEVKGSHATMPQTARISLG